MVEREAVKTEKERERERDQDLDRDRKKRDTERESRSKKRQISRQSGLHKVLLIDPRAVFSHYKVRVSVWSGSAQT